MATAVYRQIEQLAIDHAKLTVWAAQPQMCDLILGTFEQNFAVFWRC